MGRLLTPRDRLAAVLAPDVLDAIEELVAEQVRAELERRRDTAPVSGARWLTLEQAGERLGCSRDAIRMRVKRGRLEYRRQGRRLYVSAENVDTLTGGA